MSFLSPGGASPGSRDIPEVPARRAGTGSGPYGVEKPAGTGGRDIPEVPPRWAGTGSGPYAAEKPAATGSRDVLEVPARRAGTGSGPYAAEKPAGTGFGPYVRGAGRGAYTASILGGLWLVLVSLGSAFEASAADLEAWRSPVPEQVPVLLVQNATIWTSGPDGILEEADLLVRDGKIAAIGTDLEAPRGAVVIDGAGKHVTPGIIDAHSHLGITGGVNESGATITAEVRVEDVLDSEDPTLYRQLAGGVTAAQLLHGSSNAIGGQSAVIKFRWGAPPQGLLFEGAPPAIKFALGENPKKTNRTQRLQNHFPSTRAGIDQQMRERFLAAKSYQAQWQRFRSGEESQEPRRDLQLEALVEILEGQRRVNSHSYRADEILMLLSLGEELGFSVAVFQHVLEGYKVADEMAAHGAGASTFSDWWAYKFEVLDAIPYNAALMHERGVLVSLNSDSDELGRRLNLEAAKAVRYGNVPPQEALKMVTLNPAIQMGVADRVGSLEPGKDGDFVLWSASPLSTQALCEETWIEGRRYFSRAEDLAARSAWEAERQALIAKVRALEKKPTQEAGGEAPKPGGGS